MKGLAREKMIKAKELKPRGGVACLIAADDGLQGFPEAQCIPRQT